MKLSAAIRREPFAGIAREEETELRDDVTALIRAAGAQSALRETLGLRRLPRW